MTREVQGVGKGEVNRHIPAPVPAQQENVSWSLEGKRANAPAPRRDDDLFRVPQARSLQDMTQVFPQGMMARDD